MIPREALSKPDELGNTIPQDFDGDGIANDDELTSNIWVADYPRVEASIAAPVTMKIEILETSSRETKEILSEITSKDIVRNENSGSERIHRNEINKRTTQYKDSYSRNSADSSYRSGSRSSSSSSEFSLGASGWGFGISAGGKVASSSSQSWARSLSRARGSSETRNKWIDMPYKNNLDRDAWSIKSSAAARKARKYLRESKSKIRRSSVVKANAGYIRATLYLKNLSVNMPVKLSNIECSFMLETPQGQLTPVKTFHLRNDDFSPFQVDVYGAEQYGPYVVELKNLNTSEIQDAIRLGYSPKIFIVKYKMSHVRDSHYKNILSSYSGENLKIVEGNAKSSTALLRIIGPGVRDLYRVSAFETEANKTTRSNPCSQAAKVGSSFKPGIPLRKALERISCSGVDVQFENYIIDLSESFPNIANPKVFVRGIKSLAGIDTRVVTEEVSATGSDGQRRKAYKFKPFSKWTDIEKRNFGMWVVFANGRYYNYSEYLQHSGKVVSFDGVAINDGGIPIIKGYDSTIWVGDTYDLVYLSYKDFISSRRNYGTNPLETGESVKINTKWDLSTVGDRPFEPEVHSKFLGKVGLGDEIELEFHLKKTKYLDPNFGADLDSSGNYAYQNFSYDFRELKKRFHFDEALDFEVSLGLGGKKENWTNLRDIIKQNSKAKGFKSCGKSGKYTEQIFKVCITLPHKHEYVGANDLVGVYIRPALNNAYRNSIWPEDYRKVKKFRAKLAKNYPSGASQINITEGTGLINVNDQLQLGGASYKITALSNSNKTLSISPALRAKAKKDMRVFVKANLRKPQVQISMSSGFATKWNTSPRSPYKTLLASISTTAGCKLTRYSSTDCLGLSPNNLLLSNWLGGASFYNNWLDASKYKNFLQKSLNPFLATQGSQIEDIALQVVNAGDFLVSSRNLGSQDHPEVSISNGKALVVWQSSNNSIQGRFVDMKTGKLVASRDFLVSSTNQGSQLYPQVSISNGKALVVWYSKDNDRDYDIRGRIIDMSTGRVLGHGDFFSEF